jgi:hypothetical protein
MVYILRTWNYANLNDVKSKLVLKTDKLQRCFRLSTPLPRHPPPPLQIILFISRNNKKKSTELPWQRGSQDDKMKYFPLIW